MKKITLIIGMITISWLCYADDAGKTKLAEELVDVLNLKQATEQSIANGKQLLASHYKKLGEATGKTKEEIEKQTAQANEQYEKKVELLKWDNLKEKYIKIYAETFTEEELKGLIDFYKTPVGQKYIEKELELNMKKAAIMQSIAAENISKLRNAAPTSNKTPKSESEK